jgi:thiol-disulfide isomerase/thioredoxin
VSLPRRLLIAVIVVVSAAAFALFGLKSASTAKRPAPALPTTALAGRPVTLADLRGRPAFLVFWASWCGPCAGEAPAIERFARSLGGRASLVGVNWNDPSTSAARAFIRRYGWSFPTLLDGDGLVGDRLGLRVLPTTYVLDRSGMIAATLTGQQTEQSLQRALQTTQ